MQRFNLSLTAQKNTFADYNWFMKKFLVFVTIISLALNSQAQTPAATEKIKKDWSKVSLSNRPNDHFMIQLGYDFWANKPDSIRTKGLSRSLNVYFLFDFPFKTDPRWSIGIGAGIGSSHIFFDKIKVDINALTNDLNFPDVADTSHFKKYKLSSVYAEAPVELRFCANPENSNKSWKGAVGIKVGTMLSAYTKGKNLQNSAGQDENPYVEKLRNKRYFNSTRFCLTGRIGFGNISLFGQYQVTTQIRDGLGPDVHPVSVGLTLSGL